MKKTILTLALVFSGVTLFAQSAEETLNKWISTYSQLNTEKNWDGMIQNFDQCRTESPDWAFAFYYKGLAEYNKNNYQASVAAFTEFIGKNSEDKTIVNKAYMFRAQGFNKQGLYQQAIQDCDELLKFDANDKEAMLEKANAHMGMKDYTNYIADLQGVLTVTPNDAELLKNIANAYGMQKNWAGVVEYTTKAIAINPNEASFYDLRGRSYCSLQPAGAENFQNALNDFNKAEELGIKTSQLYNYRAKVNKALNNLDGAIVDYSKLLELNPQDMATLYQRATTYLKLAKYKEAMADADKIIEADAQNVKALKVRANCKSKLGDAKGAQADAALIKEIEGK
ncbi:MAG: tetratricopeptide repeat protein [Bacteroidales bacterium]|nr:tetratricopeptide repeat protein [Bacteroidales bacterium]